MANVPQYAPTPLDAKIISFRHEAKLLREGVMVPPRMSIIYPTSGCNMRCFGCIANAENVNPWQISIEVFDKLIESFKEMGGESVEFSGGGEPALHKHFPHLLDTIKKANLKFGMITNGTVEEHHAQSVSFASYIRVSIYTVNQLKSLENLVLARNADSKHHTRIGGKILLGISDIPLLDYLVQAIFDTGVDFVSIKCKRHCADDPELLDDTAKGDLRDQIQRLREKYSGHLFGSTEKTFQRGACWLSPLHTVVDAFGTVWICCYYQDRTDNLRIGSLHEFSFRRIWNSAQHREIMNNVDVKQCNHYDCRFHVMNDIANEYLSKSDPWDLAFI
jgi:sulfatase maturation enzyme AslB (radical SAM superfamily)